MDKNDGMIYWPDPADEKTKGPTRGSNGCEWCIINLGRSNCTYISDLANCPLTDEQVILLNNFFLALQQRKLGPENEDAIRKAIAGEGRLRFEERRCGKCKHVSAYHNGTHLAAWCGARKTEVPENIDPELCEDFDWQDQGGE